MLNTAPGRAVQGMADCPGRGRRPRFHEPARAGSCVTPARRRAYLWRR